MSINSNHIYVVSGYAPGNSGIGRVLHHLIDSNVHDAIKFKFFYRIRNDINLKKKYNEKKFFQLFINLIKIFYHELQFIFALRYIINNSKNKLIILHPQSIGFGKVIDLINRRNKNTWIYVMDNSYFCVKSYNQFLPVDKECLKCLNKFDNSNNTNCEPFPFADNLAFKFIESLKDFVEQKKISFYSQNHNQTLLLQNHFGSNVNIKEIGLWAHDWNLSPNSLNTSSTLATDLLNFDIVFHGNNFDAKGTSWSLKLAKLLPELTFLFPFDPPSGLNFLISDNCHFIPMNWETGLEYHVKHSKIVLVPSLWSAPIEGALIKSLLIGHLVCVVNIDTSFSAEIPDDIILKLDFDINIASKTIRSHLKNGLVINNSKKDEWITNFIKNNSSISLLLKN